MEEMVPITIDLSAARKGELNESFLRMFGGMVQMALERMFGVSDVPIKVKGKKSEIEAFSKALDKEKRYLTMYQKYGLNDPRTFKNKYKLQNAIKNFEDKTGLIWPLK